MGGSPGSTQRCVNVRVWPTSVAQCPDRGRRLVRDYETIPATHEAMIWTAANLAAQQPPDPLTQFTGALLRQGGRRYARGGCPAVQVGRHALSATAARIVG